MPLRISERVCGLFSGGEMNELKVLNEQEVLDSGKMIYHRRIVQM